VGSVRDLWFLRRLNRISLVPIEPTWRGSRSFSRRGRRKDTPIKHSKLLYTVALALAPQFCLAQQLAFNAPSEESAPVAASSIVKSAPATVTAPSWEPKFDRWIDLKEFDFSMRYRGVTDSNGAHEFSQGQQRGVIDGKFKLDEQGKYGIVFHASTGKTFNWSYANFIGGGNKEALAKEYAKASPSMQGGLYAEETYLDPNDVKDSYNSGGWSFYMRRLYLDIEPIKGIEAEYGSLDFNRGAASEITTYDNDGYISGARILIKRPKQLFLDEISVTYAYMGDLYKPNMFARTNRFTQSNYHQFLVRKQVGKHLNTSFDYTWQSKIQTLNEAVWVNIPESRVINSVRFETYQRINTATFPEEPAVYTAPTGKGFAVTLAKKVNSRVAVDGGYASIDLNDTIRTREFFSSGIGLDVNGDSYGIGKRVFVHPVIKLTPYLEATAFYTHQSGPANSIYSLIWNHQALQAGLNFDIKKALFPKRDVQ
jgi:hypothetical protein